MQRKVFVSLRNMVQWEGLYRQEFTNQTGKKSNVVLVVSHVGNDGSIYYLNFDICESIEIGGQIFKPFTIEIDNLVRIIIRWEEGRIEDLLRRAVSMHYNPSEHWNVFNLEWTIIKDELGNSYEHLDPGRGYTE